MSFSTILVDCVDGITTLTLNRPNALNAMTTVMVEEISRVAKILGSCAVCQGPAEIGMQTEYYVNLQRVIDRWAEQVGAKG